jgi:hypothetical protein
MQKIAEDDPKSVIVSFGNEQKGADKNLFQQTLASPEYLETLRWYTDNPSASYEGYPSFNTPFTLPTPPVTPAKPSFGVSRAPGFGAHTSGIVGTSVRKGRQGGGAALERLDYNLNEIPYVMTLQKLWEDKNKHYKALQPEYQQMLPPPDEAPVNSIKDPFHEYMDEFGDQDILEEARDTIGIMKPEEAEDLFVNDNSRINEMYENALPEVNRDWIPIFIRADMLRLLSRKR